MATLCRFSLLVLVACRANMPPRVGFIGGTPDFADGSTINSSTGTNTLSVQ